MFGAFKSQRIAMQVLIPVLGLIPFAGFIFFRAECPLPVHNAQGWLYVLFSQGLSHQPLLLILLAYLQIVLISILLFMLNTRFEILGRRTVLLSYMYLIISTIPLVQLSLHPAGLSTLFIFFGLIFLFGIYHKDKPLPDIFNAGILLGLAILCYPPVIVVLLVFLIAVIRLKKSGWRDFVALLLGISVPVWIAVAILLLTDNASYAWIGFKQWFELRVTWPLHVPGDSKLLVIWFVWILLTLPLAFSRMRIAKDINRRIIGIFFQFLWIVPVMVLVFERVSLEIWQMMALPLSIVYSMMILNSRRVWMSNVIFSSHLIFMIAIQIEYFTS